MIETYQSVPPPSNPLQHDPAQTVRGIYFHKFRIDNIPPEPKVDYKKKFENYKLNGYFYFRLS